MATKQSTKKTARKPGVQANAQSATPSPPARKHTINDIARLASVSKKTVSRVINESPFVHEETRTRIRDIMKQVGYTPDPQARALAFRRSFLIGLIYDNPNAPYVINIQEGALAVLRRMGYELVVHPCDRTSPDFFDEIRRFVSRQKLDGVMLLPPVSENGALADVLKELNCAYMRVIAAPLDEAHNLILSRDRHSADQVAEHLVRLGHKRIAMITGPTTYRSSHERLTGFSEALAKRGAPIASEYVIEGRYTFESGVSCAEQLLSLTPRPTAIFAGNDETAAGVYRAAYLHGLRIPDDLTVVGFDDSPLASRLCPSLTTMHQPIRDMGRVAAESLIAKITRADPLPASATTFTPHLVVRESSGPPRM